MVSYTEIWTVPNQVLSPEAQHKVVVDRRRRGQLQLLEILPQHFIKRSQIIRGSRQLSQLGVLSLKASSLDFKLGKQSVPAWPDDGVEIIHERNCQATPIPTRQRGATRSSAKKHNVCSPLHWILKYLVTLDPQGALLLARRSLGRYDDLHLALSSKSSKNSEAGSTPTIMRWSRARVHATYSRCRSVW